MIEWIRLLLERSELINPLQLIEILVRRSDDEDDQVAVQVSRCLAKVIDYDREQGHDLAKLLMARDDLMVRRSMADVLTRLFRRLEGDAIPLLNGMLGDEDESVLAAASATIGDLRFIDKEMWANKIRELCDHESHIVRRNLVYTIRDYLEEFSSDERQIIPKMWGEGDEVVLTRLRELLIRMAEVDADRFAITIKSLEHLDIEGLWAPMKIRNEQLTLLWQQWLEGKAEQPTTPEPVQTHVSDMTEGELPDVADALAKLGDMGFLD